MIENKNGAFTLAEVLVTLMIIGVIAAVTIPGLKKSADQAEYVAGLKKAYSILSQAVSLVENDYGPYKRWQFKDGSNSEVKRMFDMLKEHLSVVRECAPDAAGCWVQSKSLAGTNFGVANGIGYNIIAFSLSDGMNICIDGAGVYGVNDGANQLGFWVDVNGDKKPNMLGYDVYLLIMSPSRGLVPAGIDDLSECDTGTVGETCAAKVLKEGKINY